MSPIIGRHLGGRHARRAVAAIALAAVVGLAVAGAGAAEAVTAPVAGAKGATTGDVTVVGAGFGHGVGLSQYGANGMAGAGATATQILQHYYTGVTVASARDDTDLRVNVAHGTRSLALSSASASASASGGLRLLPSDGAAVTVAPGADVRLTPVRGRIAVSIRRTTGGTTELSASGLTVQWPGTRALSGPATVLGLTSTTSGAPRTVRYRWGSLAVTPVGSGLEGVLVIGVHGEYLRGIAEMPSSWRPAALAAQAVAARNYALVAAGTIPRASCGGCQLWNDTRSQVYAGWSKESDTRWIDAVTATQTSSTTGLVALHAGRPITATYSSSTGGRTRNAADVWGNPVPYLVSVPDPWSIDARNNPRYAHWTRTVSVATMRAMFGLTDLATLTVIARDPGGAAKEVTATSSDGTRRTMSGNTVASALGLPGVWISSFTVPGGSVPPAPTPTTSAPTTPSPSWGSAPPAALVPAGTPDVYRLPGVRSANGRTWSTTCRPYSGTAHRCSVLIWASRPVLVGDRWTTRPGWVLNNVVYFDSAPTAWAGTVQATPGEHTAQGKRWRTTCDVSPGLRICRASVLTGQVVRIAAVGGDRYQTRQQWVLDDVLYLTSR